MQQTALSLEGVEVQGEATAMTYQIDKKVINVGQQATAISGSVVEVLENVPSVTVDIEGNVSLRGSSNFTVLIDGWPSVLEPSEALQQIPASTVENIEIITNPSAKHDPEGAAGIINIVMKKDHREGRSGIANLAARRIAGALFGEAFSRESFNWNARMSHTIKLGAAAQLQLDGIYNSPSVSPQGRREGFFTANAAAKCEFLDKLLSATLQIRDIFGSAKNEHVSQGADFYNYSYSTREAPVVMLNLKYNFTITVSESADNNGETCCSPRRSDSRRARASDRPGTRTARDIARNPHAT